MVFIPFPDLRLSFYSWFSADAHDSLMLKSPYGSASFILLYFLLASALHLISFLKYVHWQVARGTSPLRKNETQSIYEE